MAHEIYQERIALFKEPAWHHLGTVFTEPKTLEEVLEIAGCNYGLSVEPVYVLLDGNYVDCDNRVAVVRHGDALDPEPAVLEIVSKDYQLVTNLQLVQYYNELSKKYPVETMGALGRGETFFFALDAGEIEINGDLVHQYFLVTDSKVATAQTRIVYTPVRVLCANTMKTGLNQATFNLGVPHRTGNHERLQEIAGISLQLEQRVEQVNGLFNGMGKSHVALAEFKELVDQLYPLDDGEEEVVPTGFLKAQYLKMSKTQENRATAVELFEKYNDENPKFGNTAWNAWQALVELEDHRPGRGLSQFTSSLFGARAVTKEKAFALLTK